MYHNILIPIALDHEHDVSRAIAIARSLVAEGGRITALHVAESVPGYVSQYLPPGHTEQMRAEQLESLKELIANSDDIEAELIPGHSSNTILEYATNHKSDLIIIDSHRPGLQDYFLGSTAARVVRHAHCAVHVIR
ncbi:MAG: universal stress protein [Arenibacterium sp.]